MYLSQPQCISNKLIHYMILIHLRLQHPPEGPWPTSGPMQSPQGSMSPHGMSPHGMSPHGMSPHGMSPHGMSPHGIPPGGPGFPRQQGPQMSPRTPSPFTSPSPGGMYTPSHSPAMQSPTQIQPPPRPPVPPTGEPAF